MSALLERLRQRGWRLTAQRRAIAEAFGGEHVHLTAEEVYAGARERLPEVSLATVYNTLNELVDMGELIELAPAGSLRRYDPTLEAHQHLVCTGCGDLRDVRPQGEEDVKLPRRERHGFQVTGLDIVFRGLCPDCA